MQLDVAIPLLWRQTIFQSGGVSGNPSQIIEKKVTMDPDFRVGDASLGFYYQLYPQTPSFPLDVVWSLRLKAPSGKHPYGIKLVEVEGFSGNLRVPEELPSGNGVWTLSTDFSFVKTADPAILFANLSYFYNFDRHFPDISTTAGTTVPGRIDLGDSVQFGVGTAFALNEHLSVSLAYSHRFTHKTRTKPDGGGCGPA